MKNTYIITGISIFIITTAVVLLSGNSTVKKVQFTNQNLVLNHENTQVKNEDVSINLNKSNIINTGIETKSSNTDFENQGAEIDYKPSGSQSTDYNFQNTDYNRHKADLDRKLQAYEEQKNKIKNINTTAQNNSVSAKKRERYFYKNIDWNTWKSDFVNKITDDSIRIKSLDNYGIGTWFYYSFTVTSEGEIKNITVRSMYLSDEDKMKIRNLIKGYQYKDITIFPSGTQKQTAKVEAVMMLGTSEKKAAPSDFNDNEKVKIILPD